MELTPEEQIAKQFATGKTEEIAHKIAFTVIAPIISDSPKEGMIDELNSDYDAFRMAIQENENFDDEEIKICCELLDAAQDLINNMESPFQPDIIPLVEDSKNLIIKRLTEGEALVMSKESQDKLARAAIQASNNRETFLIKIAQIISTVE